MTTSGCLPVIGWLPEAESTPNRNGHISFGKKLSGKPGAGKRHAGFDVAGTGNVNNGSRTEDQRESAGVTTEPYSQRACSRPYLKGRWRSNALPMLEIREGATHEGTAG